MYLASLLLASDAMGRTSRPLQVRPEPDNEPAFRLYDRAIDVLMGRLIVATSAVNRYSFVADLPGSVFFGLGKESIQLTMVDVPGGGCVPSPEQRFSDDVLDDLAQADALLFVVPGDQELRPPNLIDRFAELLDLVRERKGIQGGRPAFLRMAITLTMAELHVAPGTRDVVGKVEQLKPASTVREALGQSFVEVVRHAVAPGGDGYFLVSAFGFDRRTGARAAIQGPEGWHLDGENAYRDWWPYRVYEPIEFLARGVCWRSRLNR